MLTHLCDSRVPCKLLNDRIENSGVKLCETSTPILLGLSTPFSFCVSATPTHTLVECFVLTVSFFLSLVFAGFTTSAKPQSQEELTVTPSVFSVSFPCHIPQDRRKVCLHLSCLGLKQRQTEVDLDVLKAHLKVLSLLLCSKMFTFTSSDIGNMTSLIWRVQLNLLIWGIYSFLS